MVMAAAPALAGENMLPDGSGFETGPDGWDVLGYRVFQDPGNPQTKYPRAFELISTASDSLDGLCVLVLKGNPHLQMHEVRFPAMELHPDTDYALSIYAKVVSEYFQGGCEPATFGASLTVTNGDGTALASNHMRDVSAALTTCWDRLYFHFNTADIDPGVSHPLNMYGLKLTIDSTKRSVTDVYDYQVLLNAAMFEVGTLPTEYEPSRDYDIGLDIIPAADDAPVTERALRHYRLFEEDEPLEFRYWIYAKPGLDRPSPIGYRVVDAYALNDNGKPLVFIKHRVLPDPGNGIAGNFTIDHADLEGGSGTYRVVVGAPLELVHDNLVFGILHPPHWSTELDPEQIAFGTQVGNFKYLHRMLNEDGDPNNDLPECEGAEPGDPLCSRRLLYAMGPDPNLPFWMLDRLGLPHMRIKHVFHPSGWAPIDTITGTWDLTFIDWFVDTAGQHDLQILGMTGDGLSEVENFRSLNVNGYPPWMSPKTYPDPIGWQNFLAGHERAFEELAAVVGDRVYGYEIFNEPTRLGNSITPERLVALNQVSTDILRDAGLSVKGIGFGLTGMGPRGVVRTPDFPQGRDTLFGEFIALGGLNAMDAAAMHLAVTSEIGDYPDSLYRHGLEMRLAYCGGALKTEIERLIDALDPVNRGMPFHVTETSFLSGSVYRKYNVPKSIDVGEGGRRVDDYREAARLVTQQFINILGSGWERGYLFNFDATLFVGVHNGVFRSLVDVHGSPRPALNAYYNVAQNLAGATLVERMEGENAIRIYYKFERGPGDVIVAYSLDASLPDLRFQLEDPVLYIDMWGNRMTTPKVGVDPIYIHGQNLDLLSISQQIEAQARASHGSDPLGGKASPGLSFQRIPRVSKTWWDFECPAHIWLPFVPNPEDLTGRNVEYLQRFVDGQGRGLVLGGEFCMGYFDEFPNISTSVHSGETVLEGSELLTRYNNLCERVLVRNGHAEQYLVISDRAGSQSGVYLIGYSDTNLYSDPRYLLPEFSVELVDFDEKRIDLPLHRIDLVELLSDNGFFVIPGVEYLLDIVTFTVGAAAAIVIDDVCYTDSGEVPGPGPGMRPRLD